MFLFLFFCLMKGFDAEKKIMKMNEYASDFNHDPATFYFLPSRAQWSHSFFIPTDFAAPF